MNLKTYRVVLYASKLALYVVSALVLVLIVFRIADGKEPIPAGTAYYMADEEGALFLFDSPNDGCVQDALGARLVLYAPHPYAGEYDGCYAFDETGEAAFIVFEDGTVGVVLRENLVRVERNGFSGVGKSELLSDAVALDGGAVLLLKVVDGCPQGLRALIVLPGYVIPACYSVAQDGSILIVDAAGRAGVLTPRPSDEPSGGKRGAM